MNIQYFRQSQLPRGVAFELHGWAEENQQIRLARDMIVELRINQVHVNLLLSHIALLRHLGQCARQIDNGVAAVVFGQKEYSEMLALFFEAGAIRLSRLRGCIGRGVGAQVRCPDREGRFAAGAKVGLESAPDAGVCLREVVFEDAWMSSALPFMKFVA